MVEYIEFHRKIRNESSNYYNGMPPMRFPANKMLSLVAVFQE
jgi:hypothetical protein